VRDFRHSSASGWWESPAGPARDIGQVLVDTVPNAFGLHWIDFTVRETSEPDA
jgi:hypothetical protein